MSREGFLDGLSPKILLRQGVENFSFIRSKCLGLNQVKPFKIQFIVSDRGKRNDDQVRQFLPHPSLPMLMLQYRNLTIGRMLRETITSDCYIRLLVYKQSRLVLSTSLDLSVDQNRPDVFSLHTVCLSYRLLNSSQLTLPQQAATQGYISQRDEMSQPGLSRWSDSSFL